MYLSTEWKIRLDSKIRSQNVHFHDSFWREQTLAAAKLLLSLTRMDFAVAVSSRAVRVFPALSLRRVRPSYGTFSLMGFQENYARGRMVHMIKIIIKILIIQYYYHHYYWVTTKQVSMCDLTKL